MLSAVQRRHRGSRIGSPTAFRTTLHLHDTFDAQPTACKRQLDFGVRSFDSSAGGWQVPVRARPTADVREEHLNIVARVTARAGYACDVDDAAMERSGVRDAVAEARRGSEKGHDPREHHGVENGRNARSFVEWCEPSREEERRRPRWPAAHGGTEGLRPRPCPRGDDPAR